MPHYGYVVVIVPGKCQPWRILSICGMVFPVAILFQGHRLGNQNASNAWGCCVLLYLKKSVEVFSIGYLAG
jgi:hypothetical protein